MNQIITTAVAVAALCSTGAATLAGAGTQAQQTLPDVNVQISLTLKETDGTPISGDTFLLVEGQGGNYFFKQRFAFDVNGTATWVGQLDADTAAKRQVNISVYLGDPERYITRPVQFFTSAADGKAAFAKKVVLMDGGPAGGVLQGSAVLKASEPPLYAEITTSTSTPGCWLAMRDFKEDREFERYTWHSELAEPEGFELPLGLATTKIYRWNTSPGSEYVIKSQTRRAILSEGFIRRGGLLPITVPTESILNIQVNNATLDSRAVKVVVVRPQDHEPNPSSATGSDVSYENQKLRSVAYFNAKPGTATAQKSTGLRTDDYVVELWGKEKQNGRTVNILLSAQAVTAGQLGNTLVVQ